MELVTFPVPDLIERRAKYDVVLQSEKLSGW